MNHLITVLSFTFLTSSVVFASNDWNKPCFGGQCSYNLRKNGQVLGTLEISGSADAISDITPAAGWVILGCSPNADVQDIRLVCQDPSTCGHLFRRNRAAGKIVRLPDNCGKSAFARVVRNWVHTNQTIPADVKRRLHRRGTLPQVQGITLDTNFEAIDPSQLGEVAFFIQGSTVPEAVEDKPSGLSPIKRHATDRFARRGIFDGIKDGLEGIGKDVGDALGSISKIDLSKTVNLSPIDVNKDFPLLSKSLSCPASAPGEIATSASISVDVNTNLHALVQVGVVAKGSLIPPSISEFALFAGLDADFAGTLNLVASASGSIDSGVISFFEVGVPGLDFPGILSIGPTFKIQGQARASLQSDLNIKLGMAYHTQGTKLFFPPSASQASGGNFVPADSPLKLSVDQSISVKGSIEAHLIPRVEFGISALKGLAKATVFLDLDASATLSLDLNEHASASTILHSSASSSATSSTPSTTFTTVSSKASVISTLSTTSIVSSSSSKALPDSSSSLFSATHSDSSPSVSLPQPSVSNTVLLPILSPLPTDTAVPSKTDTKPSSSSAVLSSSTFIPSLTTVSTPTKSDIHGDNCPSPVTVTVTVTTGYPIPSSSASDTPLSSSNSSYIASSTSTHKADYSTTLAPDAPKYTESVSSSTPVYSASQAIATPKVSPLPSNVTAPTVRPVAGPYVGHHYRARGATASLDGCVEVTAGLNVNAGADGSFFKLFNTGTKVPLFSKKFEVFKVKHAP
ncbi:hypothetical protein ONZ45_g3930 [Pleurotus djamor]|nr:hypothetical protein ONZ45_g3930 [Pleurotus djamor]